MSSVSRYPDEHTLYVTTGAVGNSDLVQSVSKALRAFEKDSHRKYPCEIISNLIFDREEVPYGFGYLYVSNAQVYNMLIGKNPNGTERTKIVEKVGIKIYSPDQGTEWVDDWSQEERSMIVESLPKLLNPPNLKYTQEQKVNLQKLIARIRSSEKQHFDPDNFHPEISAFKFEQAHVKPLDEQYSLNILCGRRIPVWLDPESVYATFRPFITDKRVKKKTRAKKKFIEASYPVITINRKNGLCFVEFNPKSRDAQFALLMTTKVIFKNRNKPSQRAMVFFTHSFKSKRK